MSPVRSHVMCQFCVNQVSRSALTHPPCVSGPTLCRTHKLLAVHLRFDLECLTRVRPIATSLLAGQQRSCTPGALLCCVVAFLRSVGHSKFTDRNSLTCSCHTLHRRPSSVRCTCSLQSWVRASDCCGMLPAGCTMRRQDASCRMHVAGMPSPCCRHMQHAQAAACARRRHRGTSPQAG